MLSAVQGYLTLLKYGAEAGITGLLVSGVNLVLLIVLLARSRPPVQRPGVPLPPAWHVTRLPAGGPPPGIPPQSAAEARPAPGMQSAPGWQIDDPSSIQPPGG